MGIYGYIIFYMVIYDYITFGYIWMYNIPYGYMCIYTVWIYIDGIYTEVLYCISSVNIIFRKSTKKYYEIIYSFRKIIHPIWPSLSASGEEEAKVRNTL